MWDGVDRRKFVRAEYPCLITLRKRTPPLQGILTHTIDICAFGMGVLISKKIEVMTEVDLEIDLKDTLPTIVSKGVVKWVKEVRGQAAEKPAQYATGIQFTALDDEFRRRIQKIVEHIQAKIRR